LLSRILNPEECDLAPPKLGEGDAQPELHSSKAGDSNKNWVVSQFEINQRFLIPHPYNSYLCGDAAAPLHVEGKENVINQASN